MEEESCNYDDVINYLFYQQFFEEPSFLTDRTSKVKINISKASDILADLVQIVKNIVPLWEKGKEKKFLKRLCEILDLDKQKVVPLYERKANSLPGESKNDKCLKLMFALSETIHFFHNKTIKKAHFILKEKSKLKDKEFSEAIGKLSQNADPDLSLFHNFHILLDYAKLTNHNLSKVIIAKTYSKVLHKIANRV